ncbi:hypothetical protein GGX14DRAFT_576722 [Mycena pura]|uniref:Uncharacterized protein n=1 Tax=Mycena pura TaxID=153505 RepID=A0AAD6UTG3_9AGAR|nr:hypothetical protein GGX14DRAFT_576722 [Mycena pura]
MDATEYSLALMPKRYGYPVYLPSPPTDLPEDIWRSGTQIGDVGVLCSDGSFDPIFNICRPEGHPANQFGVPRGFVALALGPKNIKAQALFHPPGAVISNWSRSSCVTFVDEGLGNWKETALLHLPHGASTQDLRNSQTFRDVAFKHARNWYSFVQDNLQRIVGNSDLYLVTGVTKSKSWSIRTVENLSDEPLGGVNMESTIVSGPYHRPGEELWENQTVFIRGFKISVRSSSSGVLPEIVDCEVTEDKNLSEQSNSHPSNVINQHILDSDPTAMVAVTHDEEWTAVLEETDLQVPDREDLIRRIYERSNGMFG